MQPMSNRGEKGGWASNENLVLTGTRLIGSDVIQMSLVLGMECGEGPTPFSATPSVVKPSLVGRD